VSNSTSSATTNLGFMSNGGMVNLNGVANPQVLEGLIEQDGAVSAWTQAGGLSLPIEIQFEGNVLRFSRASGSPRLALTVRPNESDKLGLGLVWAAIWASIALWLLRLINGTAKGCAWRQGLVGLCVLGLLGMLFLPSPLSELCFLTFALTAIVLSIGVLRSRRQNTAA
jgi:hypothetical protein